MRNAVRVGVFGLMVAAGLALAPAAFARGHLNVGVNIGLPGISLGYRDCHHCGWGGDYGYAAPVYYGASYYEPAYYEPAYYPAYPAYGAIRYSDGYYDHDRHYRHGGSDRNRYHGRGDGGHRAHYYDRGGDHHR